MMRSMMRRLCLVLVFIGCDCFLTKSHGLGVATLFQFGDSLSDTGNRAIAFPKASTLLRKSPYGMTYFHHPADRISDGRLIIDFIATRLGLPLLNPYLSNQSFTHGVNFAVAGATAVSLETYKAYNLFPLNTFALDTQLDWFLKFKQKSSDKFSLKYFEEALYIVGEIGGNDYGRMWTSGWSYKKVQSFVHLVVSRIENHTRSLYNAGGRKFMIVNLPVQGCNPRNFASSVPDDKYDGKLGCILRMKRIGKEHNLKLKALVHQLERELDDAFFIYADFYEITDRIMQNVSRYGMKNRKEACCGIYTHQINVDCGEIKKIKKVELKGTACKHPSDYVFWNDNHYTEHFHNIVADFFLIQLEKKQ